MTQGMTQGMKQGMTQNMTQGMTEGITHLSSVPATSAKGVQVEKSAPGINFLYIKNQSIHLIRKFNRYVEI